MSKRVKAPKAAKLPNGLYYSDEEILILYRDSKDKKEELHILAELNLCKIDDIRQALMRAGIDGRTIPKTRELSKESSDNNELSQFIREATSSYSKVLEDRKAELESLISNMQEELDRINEELQKCNKSISIAEYILSQKELHLK